MRQECDTIELWGAKKWALSLAFMRCAISGDSGGNRAANVQDILRGDYGAAIHSRIDRKSRDYFRAQCAILARFALITQGCARIDSDPSIDRLPEGARARRTRLNCGVRFSSRFHWAFVVCARSPDSEGIALGKSSKYFAAIGLHRPFQSVAGLQGNISRPRSARMAQCASITHSSPSMRADPFLG